MVAKTFGIHKKLSTALTETLISADEFRGKLRLEGIRISKVNLDPNNPREFLITKDDVILGIKTDDPQYEIKQREIESLSSLAHSIKINGLMNPILVYEKGSEFVVLAGERRTLATLIAGKDRIEARILPEKPSDRDLPILQWVENIERQDLTLKEKISNLEKIFDVSLRSAKHIEEILGCGHTMAHNYAKLLQPMNKTLKTSIEDGTVNSIKKAILLIKLDEEEIKEYLSREDQHQQVRSSKFKPTLKEIDEKIKSKNKIKKTGVRKQKIEFGETKKIEVAKKLYLAFKKDEMLKHEFNLISEPDWSDVKTINRAFAELVYLLEENCGE
jgi:ParB family chromosome partitioning protein